MRRPVRSPLKKFGFAWVTIGFLVISTFGHWLFGWFAFAEEQQAHSQPVETGTYVVAMPRDTFENWQSEFLQLLWQVVGLTLLLYVGSPPSKESEDRTEEMLKEIIRKVEPKDAEKFLTGLEQKYPSK